MVTVGVTVDVLVGVLVGVGVFVFVGVFVGVSVLVGVGVGVGQKGYDDIQPLQSKSPSTGGYIGLVLSQVKFGIPDDA